MVFGVLTRVLGRPLTAHGGKAIIPFEISWTPAGSAAVLAGWDAHARGAARRQMQVDFGFLTSCSLFFSLASTGAASWWDPRSHCHGVSRHWVPLGKPRRGVLDATENVALLRILSHSPHTPWPQVAGAAASVKLTILAVAALYLAATGVGGLTSLAWGTPSRADAPARRAHMPTGVDEGVADRSPGDRTELDQEILSACIGPTWAVWSVASAT